MARLKTSTKIRKTEWTSLELSHVKALARRLGVDGDDARLTIKLATEGTVATSCTNTVYPEDGSRSFYIAMTNQGAGEFDVELVWERTREERFNSVWPVPKTAPTVQHDAHVRATLEYVAANDPEPQGEPATVGEMIEQIAAAQHAARCHPSCPVHGTPTDDDETPSVRETLARVMNAAKPAGIDYRRTATHTNGITQVFRTAQVDRAMGEPAIGAFQRYAGEDFYRTYAPDGSSRGTYPTDADAYRAIVDNDGRYTWAASPGKRRERRREGYLA